MQTPKNQRENSHANQSRFTKRIGSTLYEVNVHFSTESKETLEDKIFRLIENYPLKNNADCSKLRMLQTERLPEEGSA